MAERLTLPARIKALSAPLNPQPTGETPWLPRLPGIRAVVFDVYGTLLVSASGDISLANENASAVAAEKALEAIEVFLPASGAEVAAELRAQIRSAHVASPREHPEVEIRDIWRHALRRWETSLSNDAIERLAVEYECRVNPVWPMPAMIAVLDSLSAAGFAMGIVSNAQFFTPIALASLADRTLAMLGFDPSLCIWSYELGEAKPGSYVYQRCVAALAERGISPGEALYVGNDMLNDICPASGMGFRTALFAGDARSLRRREGDPRLGDVEPDATVTELSQLLEIVA